MYYQKRVKDHTYKRVTAFITGLIFVFTQFVFYPQPFASAKTSITDSSQQRLTSSHALGGKTALTLLASARAGKSPVPPELGTVQGFYVGHSQGTVILLEDAHANPDAQQSIQKMIGHLQSEYGINTIAFEGSEGQIEPTLFRHFPDKERLRTVISGYLANGELSGVTAASVLNDQQALYQGIEDPKLYEEGISLFLESLQKEHEFKKQLREIEDELGKRKKEVYSPEALRFDQDYQIWVHDVDHLPQFLSFLSEIDQPTKDRFPALHAVMRLIEESKSGSSEMNPKIEDLYKEIRDKIKGKPASEELNRQYQAWRTEEISLSGFVHYLDEISPEKEWAQELLGMINQEKKFRELQGLAFFEELERYIAKIKAGIFKSKEEKALDQETHRLNLYEKLSRLELTREEWEELKGFLGRDVEVGSRKYEVGKTKPGSENIDDDENPDRFRNHLTLYFRSLTSISQAFPLFYRNAEAREQVFLDKLAALLVDSKTDQVLFVAGGFHTEGMAKRLREEGTSYVVITPKMTKIPERDVYLNLMRGQVSWSEYFKVQNGRINLYDAFIRATLDRLLYPASSFQPLASASQPFLLKEWRDQLIKKLFDAGRVEDANAYTKYLDEYVRQKMDPDYLESLISKYRMRLEKFVSGLRDLEAEDKISQANILKLLSHTINHAFANPLVRSASIPDVWVRPGPGSEFSVDRLETSDQRPESVGSERSELRDEEKPVLSVVQELNQRKDSQWTKFFPKSTLRQVLNKYLGEESEGVLFHLQLLLAPPFTKKEDKDRLYLKGEHLYHLVTELLAKVGGDVESLVNVTKAIDKLHTAVSRNPDSLIDATELERKEPGSPVYFEAKIHRRVFRAYLDDLLELAEDGGDLAQKLDYLRQIAEGGGGLQQGLLFLEAAMDMKEIEADQLLAIYPYLAEYIIQSPLSRTDLFKPSVAFMKDIVRQISSAVRLGFDIRILPPPNDDSQYLASVWAEPKRSRSESRTIKVKQGTHLTLLLPEGRQVALEYTGLDQKHREGKSVGKIAVRSFPDVIVMPAAAWQRTVFKNNLRKRKGKRVGWNRAAIRQLQEGIAKGEFQEKRFKFSIQKGAGITIFDSREGRETEFNIEVADIHAGEISFDLSSAVVPKDWQVMAPDAVQEHDLERKMIGEMKKAAEDIESSGEGKLPEKKMISAWFDFVLRMMENAKRTPSDILEEMQAAMQQFVRLAFIHENFSAQLTEVLRNKMLNDQRIYRGKGIKSFFLDTLVDLGNTPEDLAVLRFAYHKADALKQMIDVLIGYLRVMGHIKKRRERIQLYEVQGWLDSMLGEIGFESEQGKKEAKSVQDEFASLWRNVLRYVGTHWSHWDKLNDGQMTFLHAALWGRLISTGIYEYLGGLDVFKLVREGKEIGASTKTIDMVKDNQIFSPWEKAIRSRFQAEAAKAIKREKENSSVKKTQGEEFMTEGKRSELRFDGGGGILTTRFSISRYRQKIRVEEREFELIVAPLDQLSSEEKQLLDELFRSKMPGGDYVFVLSEEMWLGMLAKIDFLDMGDPEIDAGLKQLVSDRAGFVKEEAERRSIQGDYLGAVSRIVRVMEFFPMHPPEELKSLQGLLAAYYHEPIFFIPLNQYGRPLISSLTMSNVATEPEVIQEIQIFYEGKKSELRSDDAVLLRYLEKKLHAVAMQFRGKGQDRKLAALFQLRTINEKNVRRVLQQTPGGKPIQLNKGLMAQLVKALLEFQESRGTEIRSADQSQLIAKGENEGLLQRAVEGGRSLDLTYDEEIFSLLPPDVIERIERIAGEFKEDWREGDYDAKVGGLPDKRTVRIILKSPVEIRGEEVSAVDVQGVLFDRDDLGRDFLGMSVATRNETAREVDPKLLEDATSAGVSPDGKPVLEKVRFMQHGGLDHEEGRKKFLHSRTTLPSRGFHGPIAVGYGKYRQLTKDGYPLGVFISARRRKSFPLMNAVLVQGVGRLWKAVEQALPEERARTFSDALLKRKGTVFNPANVIKRVASDYQFDEFYERYGRELRSLVDRKLIPHDPHMGNMAVDFSGKRPTVWYDLGGWQVLDQLTGPQAFGYVYHAFTYAIMVITRDLRRDQLQLLYRMNLISPYQSFLRGFFYDQLDNPLFHPEDLGFTEDRLSNVEAAFFDARYREDPHVMPPLVERTDQPFVKILRIAMGLEDLPETPSPSRPEDAAGALKTGQEEIHPPDAAQDGPSAVASEQWGKTLTHTEDIIQQEEYRQFFEELWMDFFGTLPSGASILDIATGNLRLPKIASRVSDQFRLYAVDFADIDADQIPPNIHFDRMRAEDLSPENLPEGWPGSFDVITSMYGWEYTDRGKTLATVNRLLPIGGRAHFLVHHAESVIRLNVFSRMALFEAAKENGLFRDIHEFLRSPTAQAQAALIGKLQATRMAIHQKFFQIQGVPQKAIVVPMDNWHDLGVILRPLLSTPVDEINSGTLKSDFIQAYSAFLNRGPTALRLYQDLVYQAAIFGDEDRDKLIQMMKQYGFEVDSLDILNNKDGNRLGWLLDMHKVSDLRAELRLPLTPTLSPEGRGLGEGGV
ncbi:MAG: hypothetical protein JW893_00545, partial [Candidatus Omnitrophica bacterium]|nr:hypothetical protein [Candidatus Omnitrophota bacterium]